MWTRQSGGRMAGIARKSQSVKVPHGKTRGGACPRAGQGVAIGSLLLRRIGH